MRFLSIFDLLASKRQFVRAAMSIAASALVVACGGGGTTSDNGAANKTTTSNAGTVQTGLRTLDPSFGTLKAVSYSPFRTGDQGSETPSEVDVLQDLKLLEGAGFKLIRLFSSSEKVAGTVLKVLADPMNGLNIKVQLGAYPNTFEYWVTDPIEKAKIQAANDEELARTVTYALSYPNIVLAVSVGNETMVSWSSVPISTKQMAKYVRTVRSQITQPVTVDDDWSVYSGGQPHHAAENQVAEVLAEIDYVSMHTYAHEAAKFDLFDWRQTSTALSALADEVWTWFDKSQVSVQKRSAKMMDAAMTKTRQDFGAVRSYLNGVGKSKLPLVVGETGWKAAQVGGNGQYRFFSSPSNQRMYYDRLTAWSKESGGPFNVFYFEAFDEPWKSGDDGWGLFDVKRNPRYVINKLGYEEPLYFKTPVANDPVNSALYYIYGDTLPSGATKAPQYWTGPTTNGLWFDAYDWGIGAAEMKSSDSGYAASTDGGNYLSLAPAANLGTAYRYGWGVINHPFTTGTTPAPGYDAFTTRNLSSFASGYLNFWVKANGYPGKVQVGVSTDSSDGVTHNFLVSLENGRYGYCSDVNKNEWCKVSVPLNLFKNGDISPDWTRVISPFILQDIFAETGKKQGSTAVNNLPAIYIDGIYYSKQ